MELPALVHCAEHDPNEGIFVDYCYNTVGSFSSTASTLRLRTGKNCMKTEYHDENGDGFSSPTENTIYEKKEASLTYNKNANSQNSRTDSNISNVVSLLNYQASELLDQRQTLTTKWRLEFSLAVQKFQFAVTELFDTSSTGFEFITVSVKLPRNDPKKWYHYITHSTYQQILTFFHFHDLSNVHRLNKNAVSCDQQRILEEVWILDGNESEGRGMIHNLESLMWV